MNSACAVQRLELSNTPFQGGLQADFVANDKMVATAVVKCLRKPRCIYRGEPCQQQSPRALCAEPAEPDQQIVRAHV